MSVDDSVFPSKHKNLTVAGAFGGPRGRRIRRECSPEKDLWKEVGSIPSRAGTQQPGRYLEWMLEPGGKKPAKPDDGDAKPGPRVLVDGRGSSHHPSIDRYAQRLPRKGALEDALSGRRTTRKEKAEDRVAARKKKEAAYVTSLQ